MKIQEQYRKSVEEFVRRALERYRDEIEGIILFGSVARGEGKEDSDVDVLVKERNIKDMKEIHGMAFEVSMEHSQDISLDVIGSTYKVKYDVTF